MRNKQSRSERTIVYLEPVVQSALDRRIDTHRQVTGYSNISTSEYVRSLIIDDLRKTGLLTDTILAEHVY